MIYCKIDELSTFFFCHTVAKHIESIFNFSFHVNMMVTKLYHYKRNGNVITRKYQDKTIMEIYLSIALHFHLHVVNQVM